MSLFSNAAEESRFAEAATRAANAFANYYEAKTKALNQGRSRSLRINGKEYDPELVDIHLENPPVAEPDPKLNSRVDLGAIRSRE